MTKAAMPTLMTEKAATVVSRWNRCSSAGGTAPRRITSLNSSGPMTSASAAKSPHRAASSFHVVPLAPTASVGGGAFTPIPNVYTPAGECPSWPVTCQRTVYADPRASLDTAATTTLPPSVNLVVPDRTVPSDANTWIARELPVTDSLNRSRICLGGDSIFDCVAGIAWTMVA
jgi:hypothetical protein